MWRRGREADRPWAAPALLLERLPPGGLPGPCASAVLRYEPPAARTLRLRPLRATRRHDLGLLAGEADLPRLLPDVGAPMRHLARHVLAWRAPCGFGVDTNPDGRGGILGRFRVRPVAWDVFSTMLPMPHERQSVHVRMPRTLIETARRTADQEGVSLNTYLVALVACHHGFGADHDKEAPRRANVRGRDRNGGRSDAARRR
jgi:hypothetical protein